MARVKGALATRKRRKKTLKLAKGYWGARSKHFKMALWITRISAACKFNGINYSQFMDGLKKAGVSLNRKMLSEIAIADPKAFTALVETAKEARK